MFNFDLIAKTKGEFTHTDSSINKIKEYYSDKTRHPMFGKTGSQSYLYGKTGLNHPKTGVIISPEIRSKMGVKGSSHHYFGKVYSDQERLALSIATGSTIITTDSYGIELGRYPSMRAAALALGVHNSTISKAKSQNRPVKGH